MPKSVLLVIRLSIIVSGCLDEILIFTSGYFNLNFEITVDKNCTAKVSPVEIFIYPVVVLLSFFKLAKKLWLISF